MELFETENGADFKDFAKYALSFLIDKPNIELPTILKNKIQDLAILNLGVKDMFQLRDRFEGHAYLNNIMLKIFSVYVIEKQLGISLLNYEDLKTEINNDFTLIELKGNRYRIIPFYFGTLPIVHDTIIEPIIFCSIKKDFKHGILCGVIQNEKIKDINCFMPKNHFSNKNLKKFIGFTLLENL